MNWIILLAIIYFAYKLDKISDELVETRSKLGDLHEWNGGRERSILESEMDL